MILKRGGVLDIFNKSESYDNFRVRAFVSRLKSSRVLRHGDITCNRYLNR